mmetsp:Transcript_53356/g.137994  ORF Transcript_53356/g.137994 Transcript_53356/m.137994 type:complete len:102 (+) Transcript_53356:57-362(+)|eukprot:CAMPEP_0115855382 /NCGR_PEP_ID=MMETSP0287-20121206/14513_1 /TAXON_ID=412157 /ORGANISM="Chrysochromulina rotalis, Strain UIO044" /LENGTH=101 /DNA_ID=CAMNT_0003309533 /DNA_START=38 /DNA_END=343 /DNA_ORIENTATION=+
MADTSGALVDVTSPFWTIASDSFLSAAFLFPAISVAVYLVRLHGPSLLASASGAPANVPISPEQLHARSGDASAEQLERDREESEALKADLMAKAKAADGV